MAMAETIRPDADGSVQGSSRPLLLGVAGDSASGKTTLAAGIEWIVDPDRVTRICVDDYHRFDRPARDALGLTPLNPDANDLELLARHLRLLSVGRAIRKPVYDHAVGAIRAPEPVEPRSVVIVEGLHTLSRRVLRERFDVTLYVEPAEVLRHQWKIERDCGDRGYDRIDVVRDLQRRERDTEVFIRPQREVADIVVAFRRRTGADAFADLGARLTFRRSRPGSELHGLMEALQGNGYGTVSGASNSALGSSGLVVDLDLDLDHPDCSPDARRRMQESIWRHVRLNRPVQTDRLGRYRGPAGEERRGEVLALAQLLIAAHLAESNGRLEEVFDL